MLFFQIERNYVATKTKKNPKNKNTNTDEPSEFKMSLPLKKKKNSKCLGMSISWPQPHAVVPPIACHVTK